MWKDLTNWKLEDASSKERKKWVSDLLLRNKQKKKKGPIILSNGRWCLLVEGLNNWMKEAGYPNANNTVSRIHKVRLGGSWEPHYLLFTS
jgi:hypothetical protein